MEPASRRREDFCLRPPGWTDSESDSDDELTVTPIANLATPLKPAPPSRRFALPKSDEQVELAKVASVPFKTQKDTKWCIQIWKEWSGQRSCSSNDADIEDIISLGAAAQQKWLSRFVLEVRKKDGSPYPSESLYHIVCGILRYIRQNGKPEVDFFRDKEFAQFRMVLDSEMKRLKASGVQKRKRKAEPLTVEDEKTLWEKGVLGDHTPQALLNTVFYQNGVNFALRSGGEHRQLRFKNCQIRVVEKPGERPFLEYNEDVSKNNPGGLKGRKTTPKTVVQHGNLENPARCPVRIFKLYSQLCPSTRPDDAFYLQPLTKPSADCWYSSKILGHNTLNKMVTRMCSAAGINGYKTNHSLRATTATRLYHAQVDEQLIMERTGHRSLDGVRSYKRTGKEQHAALSDIINLTASSLAPTVTTGMAASQQQQTGAQLCIQACTGCTINVNYNNK